MKSLKSLIQEHGMAAHNDMIWQLMRPSIHLQRTPTSQSSIAPGASRLGGLPHLAKGAEWPLWNDEPLAHIATINLADLPAIETDTPLPTSGLLRFWYAHGCAPWGFDPKEKGFFRVTFEPVPHSDTALAPFPIERVSPKNLSDLYAGGAYSPSLLQFISQPTLPYGDWIDQFAPHASVLDDTESYTSLVTDLHAAQQPQHRLLGHPSPQQGTMELECQLVTNGLYCGD
ncbi:MAG: YwqG family protein, partial [Phycisphaerales bacterium]|nr:YwqG family protein [Phycisphaerales bacterium]